MAFRLGKTLILTRRDKRVHINENDLNLDRICNLFKVVKETVYIEDIQRNIYFADSNGRFDALDMEDMAIYTVEGDDIEQHVSFPGPSAATYHGGGPSRNYSTFPKPIVQQRHMPLGANSRQDKKTMTRSILLADFDDNFKPVITGSAYVQFEEKDANQGRIAELIKQFTNTQESYIICDGSGFEIPDQPETRGFDFWRPSAKKFLAVKISRYHDIAKKREERVHKRKRSSTCTSVDDMQEDITTLLAHQQETVKLCRTINEDMANNSNRVEVSLTETEEKIEDVAERVITKIAELKSTIKTDLMDLSVLKDMISDAMGSSEIINVVRGTLTCQMCNIVPSPGTLVFGICCSQILGCGNCVQTWLNENETCPLCRENAVSKTIPIRSLDNILAKLTK